MTKLKQTSEKKQTSTSMEKPEDCGIVTELWGTLLKFTGFCIVVVREMACTFGLVYKNFYSKKNSAAEVINPSSENLENYSKIVCPICNREFKNDDPVVKCPEKDCGEIYHYICWHFSHGCVRPGCLASLENPRNLIIH